MNQSSGDLNNLVYRARELKRLGNSNAEIRAVLLRLGASPGDAEAVLAQISPPEKKSASNCLLWLALGLVVAVIAGGVLAALYLFPASAPAQLAQPAETVDPLSILNQLVLPTTLAATPAPVQAAALPPAAEAYFGVVWNLQGDPMDKVAQFTAAVPPAELMVPHAELAMSGALYGNAEQQLKAMEAMFEVECAGVSNNYCKNLAWEKAEIEIKRDEARSDFNDRWLRTCEDWRDYYEKAGVPFPYMEGRCKYP